MKKNDVLVGTCVDYTYEGLGIVKVDNFPYFIKHVLKGEKVEFIITKIKKNYGYGKCIHIIEPSKHRVEPFCPYFKKCGGCQIQHMSYDEQLLFKQNLVKNNMERIGDLDVNVLPTLGCDKITSYRNKAQFPVSIKENVEIGFYRLYSNEIIDMEYCKIHSEVINKVLNDFRSIINTIKYEDVFRHLLIKHAFSTNEVMVVLIVRKKNIKNIDNLVNTLVELNPNIKSIILNVNTRNDNVILGKDEYLLYGQDHITDTLDDLKFRISSKSFYQVNPIQTVNLYKKGLELANITSDDSVIDLYCGVGTISLFLAKYAKEVIGIEIVEDAIKDAKQNAKLNNLNNVTFVCSDAGTYAKKLVKQNKKPDVIFVDPPRKGCDENTIYSIYEMNPRKVVYISCNPSTLARDLKRFKELGYICDSVQPVDMFPNTYHVENVVLMSTKDK